MTARLTFSDDVPAWVRGEARHWAAALGLDDLDINVSMVDRPNGDENWAGCCREREISGWAEIELKRGREPGEIRDTLLHEMLHAALARLDWQLSERVIPLVPKPLRRHASDLYQDANEATVTRLTRALLRALPPPKEDTSCAAS